MSTTPEKASVRSEPICGRPMRLIYNATGATMFCDRPVSLHVCRGRNKDPAKAAQNKGHWYEACTQPQPEGTHFHRWRHDLPRQQLSDDSDPAFATFSAGHFSFQDLLNIPITPERCSPVSSTFNPSPFLTPTRRRTITTTPTRSPLRSNFSPIFPGIGLSLNPPSSNSAAAAPSTSSAQSTADHPRTRNIINPKNGKPMVACNGPVCRSNKAKPPTRNASHCTHSYCKKCCIAFQTSGQGGQCSLETHAPRQAVPIGVQPLDTPIQEVAVHTSNELDEYDRNPSVFLPRTTRPRTSGKDSYP